MKIITGNHLHHGRVLYLGADDHWVEAINEAAALDDDHALEALAAAQRRVTEIADLYLIDVAGGEPSGRDALKETIRSAGPTIRDDLGKQANNP
ncbi:MAG: DUF2849 domain-containing protein [Pseudomonadota bacterium]